MLHPERKIGCADEVPAKCNSNFVGGVVLIDDLRRLCRRVTTRKDDCASFTPSLDERFETCSCLIDDCCIAVRSAARYPTFDQMYISDVQLSELFDDVVKLRNRFLHEHTIEGTERIEPHADLFAVSHGFNDCSGHIEAKLGSFFDAATPGIDPLVRDVLPELVNQMTIRA